jgi:hypothetical protein
LSLSAYLEEIDIIAFQVHFLKNQRYSQGSSYWEANTQFRPGEDRQPFLTRDLVGEIYRVLRSMNFEYDEGFRRLLAAMAGKSLPASSPSPNSVDPVHPDDQEDLLELLVLLAPLDLSADPSPDYIFNDWHNKICFPLTHFLCQPRGAFWISGQILQNKKLDFTAYFPYPRFIIEEQRTQLTPEKNGKTINDDSRRIKPLLWPTTNAVSKKKSKERSKFTWEEYFVELDRERLEDEEAFLSGNPERKAYLNRQDFANGTAYLHKHINRITCYAFRGDTRPLSEIRDASGFLSGVTRTDEAVDAYKAQAKELDDALKAGHGGEAYRKVVKKLNLLTLGVYTADARFKAFISSSTSVAIAKYFANAYAEKPNLFAPTFCYAVRCVDGFHLPTDSKRLPGDERKWSKMNDAKNALVHNAEQEVAVPLAIQWKYVVGVRKIRVNATGQFFCGPVFLTDTLRQQSYDKLQRTQNLAGLQKPITYEQPDNGGFDELFELFSGKGQGVSPSICLSYPDPPFSCPKKVIIERDKPYEVQKQKQPDPK